MDTVNTIQILRDSTKQVTKTICRAEYINLETFFFFLLLKRSYFNLFSVCVEVRGQVQASVFSFHLVCKGPLWARWPEPQSLLCLLPISQQETGTGDVHHWTSFTWVPGTGA